jgi:hypothetical protein
MSLDVASRQQSNRLPRSGVDHKIAAMSQPERRATSLGKSRVRHLATFFLLAGLFATSPARAASREARERMARTACLAGDYSKGATILSQLFVETKDANYIFNQARCFEQNAHCQEAISRFEEYLRVSKRLTDEEKAETQKHISDCQLSLAKQSGQPATAAPVVQIVPAVAPLTATQAPAAPLPPVAPVQVLNAQAGPDHAQVAVSPGAGLRSAGIITAAVGGAALVAGVLLNLKVNSMASDFQSLNGYTDSKESDRKTYQTLGWVSYGVGAACVATGAVLTILGLQDRQGSTPMAFVPGPGGASAVFKGAF